jgi:hypothetical protein
VNKNITPGNIDDKYKEGSEWNAGMDRSPGSNDPHQRWDVFLRIERKQLAQRATGKMARMIGKPLEGEDHAYLNLLASDDRFMAQNGYVLLRRGTKVWHKHIDQLAPQDRLARLEYENTLVMWLRGRIVGEKLTLQLSEHREHGWARFMYAEQKELENRRNGQLRKLLDGPLPGESPEKLERLASEDEARAEEGLVELRSSDDEITYKHIEDLTKEDRLARFAAEGARVAWIAERTRTRGSHQGSESSP